MAELRHECGEEGCLRDACRPGEHDHCPNCGYDLGGLPGERQVICPECGAEVLHDQRRSAGADPLWAPVAAMAGTWICIVALAAALPTPGGITDVEWIWLLGILGGVSSMIMVIVMAWAAKWRWSACEWGLVVWLWVLSGGSGASAFLVLEVVRMRAC